ncbi:DUF748 domain-containing protein [Hydrogenophaga sp.]|uniref:DUF748 domain-containing protein n=1 Tax=Hydrogenophaga sp. TaxID=1904254 RepID=UPI002630A2CD|nr:DUF748 domain-containing protein [Hydrogenophaga sp.]MDM7949934.1 DUF748 domain-containing protein [Hydrogenophaga sp.]
MTASPAQAPQSRPALHRWTRRALIAIASLLGLWLVSWLGMPYLLKWQLQEQGTAQLGRTVTVERVDFRPWSLELTVLGLRVAGASGEGDQFHLKRLYIDAELQSLLRLAPVVDAITIEQPKISLRHLGEGRYDIDDVLQRLARPEPAEPSQPTRFALFNIVVTDGELLFADDPVGASHRLDKLNLQVPFLSNLPSRREVFTQPQLAFELNDSPFATRASTTPFADSPQTQASLDIPSLDLAPYLPYWPSAWPVRPTAGVLQLALTMSFEQREQPQVVLAGTTALNGLRVVQRGSGEQTAELLSWDRLAVVLSRVEPLAQRVDIASVELSGPVVRVTRDAAGQINLQTVADGWVRALQPQAKDAQPVPQGSAASAWSVRVGEVLVQDGRVDWADAAVKPAAALALDQLRVAVKAITWPVQAAMPFEMTALVGTTTLSVQGSATDAQASAQIVLGDLPLSTVAPYLAQSLVPPLSGRVGADASLRWQAAQRDQPMALMVQAEQVELNDLVLGAARSPLAALKQLRVSGATIDLVAQTVQVDALALDRPRLDVVREPDGRFSPQAWFPASQDAATPSAGGAAVAKPWALRINELGVNNGDIGWEDRQLTRPAALRFNGLQLQLKDLQPLANEQPLMPVNLKLRMAPSQAAQGDPGRLDVQGTLRLPASGNPRDPGLQLKAQVQAERLPVHALEPYFGDRLNLELLRADASYRGSLTFAFPPQGMVLALAGDVALEDFRANTLSPSEDLLAWKVLNLRQLALDLVPDQPLRLAVGETALSDYFARIIVAADGRINLQGLVKGSESGIGTATASVSASATPTGTTTAALAPIPSGPAPDIRFGPISLVNGRVFFSDRFIQPNYSANLSELSGGISAFASTAPSAAGTPELADLMLKGRAEGTAQLDISGKLNPLARPLALDIQGKVRDLELPPLSPYSVKYAGYGIDRGKLSVDVNYRIQPDGQLTASNQIILNQLRFGDRVDGSDAPNLPVKLAVALLADRSGVIDINLPVSGSINDPQFRIGPIIFKLIFNLIGKAITAPFSLLASALGGGGDELSKVDFAPGRAVLADEGRKRLDAVAKALGERPALSLTVVGHSDLDAERAAYQRALLDQQVLAEKRRRLARDGASISSTLVVTPAEYPALLQEVYRRADVPKPRNVIGIAKDIPQADMEALLLAAQPVTADAMRQLAVARGVAVKDYLTTQALPEDRMFLGAPVLKRPDDQWQPQAELKLAPR